MSEQSLLPEKQIHKRQTAAIWLFTIYIASSFFMPIFIHMFKPPIELPTELQEKLCNAPSEILTEDLLPFALPSPLLNLLNIIPILFLIGCWNILLKLGDDAGRVFARRWIIGAIVGICDILWNSVDMDTRLSVLNTLTSSSIPTMAAITAVTSVIGIICALYQVSGAFILAENHPEWRNELINIGALLILPFMLFPAQLPILLFQIAVLVLLKRIIRSNIFSPNQDNRIRTAKKPFITHGLIGAVAATLLCMAGSWLLTTHWDTIYYEIF